MKKDILKEFVSENIDDFDHQQPGSDVHDKIKSRLGLSQPAMNAPKPKVIQFRYWWAAAILIVGVTGLVYFGHYTPVDSGIASRPATLPAASTVAKNSDATPLIADRKYPKQEHRPQPGQHGHVHARSSMVSKQVAAADDMQANKLETGLDSKSSSVRLAAVLVIGKKGDSLSQSDLNTLCDMMNNDANTNVRLAALDVLKRADNQSQVKGLILQSISKQDDPYVQIELLASLSSEQAAEVREHLVGLTLDTVNIAPVRDQAYAALLRSNINF